MSLSPDARGVIDAIKEQTREIRKLREATEKIAKGSGLIPVARVVSPVVPEAIELDEVQHDYTSEDVEPRSPDHL